MIRTPFIPIAKRVLFAFISLTVVVYTFQRLFSPLEKDWSTEGRTALENGGYNVALEKFSVLLKMNPQDCDARLGLAKSYEGLGDKYAALKQYESAEYCAKEVLAISKEKQQKINLEKKIK